jgi:uncharacterized cysteine cluster protein YcgN (CxxCxxCC family)
MATKLALFIGNNETFDAVGQHSWEALCDDCGFGLPDTLKELPEQKLLDTMGAVFAVQSGKALSMTALR